MLAIILAAGRGSRMAKLTFHKPKGLIKLKNKTLIDWQMRALNNARIKDILIVSGYQSKKIKYNVKYIHNKIWYKTNMFYSLFLADKILSKNTCIISYSDIVYGSDIVNKLISNKNRIVLSYDPNWLNLWKKRFKNPLTDAESFKINEGKILEIGKKTNNYQNIQGQYMGLLKISPNGWKKIKSKIKILSKNELKNMDMTSILQFLINNKVNLFGIPIRKNWYEIDTKKDLKLYNSFKLLKL